MSGGNFLEDGLLEDGLLEDDGLGCWVLYCGKMRQGGDVLMCNDCYELLISYRVPFLPVSEDGSICFWVSKADSGIRSIVYGNPDEINAEELWYNENNENNNNNNQLQKPEQK